MSDILVSLVNTKGRVVWVSSHEVSLLREKGWRMIQNPKEKYYPQYDESRTGRKKEEDDPRQTKIIDSSMYADRLGIIVV